MRLGGAHWVYRVTLFWIVGVLWTVTSGRWVVGFAALIAMTGLFAWLGRPTRNEATAIIATELAKYEALDYDELAAMIDAPKITTKIIGSSGARYSVDVQAFWDAAPHGEIRVLCSVDSGGASTFVPLTDSFLKEPSN